MIVERQAKLKPSIVEGYYFLRILQKCGNRDVQKLWHQRFIKNNNTDKAFQSLKLQKIRNSSGQQLKISINKIQITRSGKHPAEFNLKQFSIAFYQAFNSLKLQNIRSFSGQQLKRITNKIQNTRSHKNPAEFNFQQFYHCFYMISYNIFNHAKI
ncbi:hypothetical protein CEXT_28691 [Caerostris extrusa]|uniref:Uncharacterized protein n=1 Tax=Caerostris extrusa TaxID=172846 RepID=A0AAV4MIU8_CAEEX|nr:hypothetical protein CEXT_28691 [Caerostris extrusa]